MANDPPTSLRMGFGHHQARAAGLGGIRPSRSPRQFNKAVKENQAWRKLRAECDKDGGWLRFVMHWNEEGLGAEEILVSLTRAKNYLNWKRIGLSTNSYLRQQGQPF